MKSIRAALALLVSILAVHGLAAADETNPAPEPAGMCIGPSPICIGGGNACCRCEMGGINCVWACCK